LSSCKAPDPVETIVADVRRAGEGTDDPALAKQARQLRAADPAVLAKIAALADGSPAGVRVRAELAALGISATTLRASLKWHRGDMPKGRVKREDRRREVPPGVRVFERGDQSELATATLEALGPDPMTFDTYDFYRYSPPLGIWEVLPAWFVRSSAERFAGCPTGPKLEPMKVGAATTLGAEALAKDRLLSERDRVTFDDAPAGIAFRNGFVTVARGAIALLGHAPEHRARFAYPFDYTPEALCPRLDAFLEQLFADVVDKFERDMRINLLQEFIGACLVGEATRYQRYLILYATGGNGKSELLRVLRAIFPPGAVTSLPPQFWGDQFKTIMLEGKRANLVDELPDGEIMSGSSVKLIVTGEPVAGEQKNKPATIFKPIAGHVLATNTPIRSTDQSEGFWRRVMILALTRRFDDAPERVLEAGQAVIDAELPAVVAWAIAGAARAQAAQGYSVPPSSVALTQEWRGESDQIRTFACEKPIASGERVQASTFYDTYREWAKDTGHATMSMTLFGRRITAIGLYDREGSSPKFYRRRAAPGGTA
jgi:P4 family phage/plasmid primase-like protien